ncbi:3'-5' exonuclease [Clostridium sp. AM58-1XD]|uniref:3'-5' exonuclease n=1 Tax=Clostridium sp. AM58-1XD TaxID=2292307 RepID=UPI0015F37775|nr:3'-5' exonuclease [Clostridium sp. AM58-1XD]
MLLINPKILRQCREKYLWISITDPRPEIITAAKSLIEHNTERFRKDIKAARDGHGEVIYKTLTDRKEELDYLSTTVSRITAAGTDPAQIAILARTNMQLDDVAAEFERRRIDYTSNDAIKDVYEHFIFEDIILPSYYKLGLEDQRPASNLK